MKISEILWRAANEHLAYSEQHCIENKHNVYYSSCIAIINVKVGLQYVGAALDWYRSLAVRDCWPFEIHAKNILADSPQEECQQIRYCWLMLASQIAEDEGL